MSPKFDLGGSLSGAPNFGVPPEPPVFMLDAESKNPFDEYSLMYNDDSAAQLRLHNVSSSDWCGWGAEHAQAAHCGSVPGQKVNSEKSPSMHSRFLSVDTASTLNEKENDKSAKIGVCCTKELSAVEDSADESGALQRERTCRWLKRLPWFTMVVSAAQIVVFIVEFVRMGVETGSPLQLKPSVNPMLGPSPYLLINMGARYGPCMHYIDKITNGDILWPCANSTSMDTNVCSLRELCGFDFKPQGAYQWWRLITAIFLHSGIIHLAFNMLLQILLGGRLEKDIGVVRFVIIYFVSGVGGFLLSANFAGTGMASVGASGAIFGIIGIDLLDLLYNWDTYKHPMRNLLLHIAEIIINFVLGLLPGLDNFAHIGGLAMGVLSGVAILQSPQKLWQQTQSQSRSHTSDAVTPFEDASIDPLRPAMHFVRRPWQWCAYGLVRIIAGLLVVAFYVLLAINFSRGGGHCSWCKYLSCLPVNGWCDQDINL